MSNHFSKQISVNTIDKQKSGTDITSKKINLLGPRCVSNRNKDFVINDTSHLTLLDKLGLELSTVLDWEELDARIYLNLLRIGPISASALAKELYIDRTKAYRAINKLLSQGIVTTTFTSPRLCVATNPKEALEMITQRKEDEIKRIKSDGKKIIEKFKEMSPSNRVNDKPRLHITQGMQNIYLFVEKLIEDSTDVVYIVTTLENIAKMYHTNIPDKIKICERNGGEVRLLTEINDNGLKLYLDRFNATKTKIGKLPSKGLLIVSKDKQLIITDTTIGGYSSTNEKIDSALCTNSPELVTNIFTLCLFLWENSKPLKALNVEVKNNE